MICFKLKKTKTGQTGNNNIKNVEIMVPLNYLINFWRTLKMPVINCKINIDLNWSKKCVILATNVANQVTIFSVTDTKLYVPVVTLSTMRNCLNN